MTPPTLALLLVLGGAAALPAAAQRVLAAAAEQPGGYLVVAQAFPGVAPRAAAFHGAEVLAWDGADFAALERELKARRPQHVLFVVGPETLDVNLHRSILQLSAALDDDLFPDFAFGYLTGRDEQAAAALWARTEQVHEQGLSSRRWASTAVTSSMKSTVYRNHLPAVAKAAGFSGDSHYFGTADHDPVTLARARQTLRALQEAAVITMTGCGDPQGTWLFSDRRNLDRTKHWDYEPAKVGQDPAGEMPRLLAGAWDGIRLPNAICWTGVCHAGATRTVFVEGDIVSTFGRTERTEVYRLAPGESWCLALLDAGAVAFLCPIAANHGMSVSREVDFALEQGASLGETIKSTWDDVFLAARGRLVLDLEVEGEPHRRGRTPVMQGGGANRILIGDPALRPFGSTPHPGEKVTVTDRREDGFDVEVAWQEGFHARGWDMYGGSRERDWSIRARIDLEGLAPAGKALRFSVTVESEHPWHLTHAEPEHWHGRRFLHLQANAPRDQVMGKASRARFRVGFAPE